MTDITDNRHKGGPAPVGPAPISVSTGDLTAKAEMEPDSACPTYIAADSFLQDKNAFSNAALEKCKKTISQSRLNRYLQMAENDLRLAVRLHFWNAAVAGSLLPTLNVAEVAIRNVAMRRLSAKYGAHWYRDNTFLERRLGRNNPLTQQLITAYQDELKKGRRGNISDYITSELTFGFWVNIYTTKFFPHLWGVPTDPKVKKRVELSTILAGFPRDKKIEDLHLGVEFVRTFRNNVAHHKDLVSKPVVENYQRTLDVIGMLCASTRLLAEQTSSFPKVWACCPIPHDEIRSK